MANKLEIPAELAHLLEKREQADRRNENPTLPAEPPSAPEVVADAAPVPSPERRTGQERRNA